LRVASWTMLAASVACAIYGYTRARATGECPFAIAHADTGETQRSLSAAVTSLRSVASQTAEPGARIFGIARKSITPDSLASVTASCVWEVPGAFAHRFKSVHEALADFSRETNALEASLGASHQQGGEPTDAGMALPARQASIRYRFRDLAVDLTVTNLSNTFVVRRQLRELGDSS
jgi:hypothetical protein